MLDKIQMLPAAAAPESSTNTNKIEHASKQFESLLIGQILKSMHEAGSSGWLGGGEDQSGESAMELAEEQFAQALASRGGLGLSRLIINGLTQSQKNPQPKPDSADLSAAKVP